MSRDFTQAEVRDLLAIAPETMRHWRKVFPPLRDRPRRTKFSAGDLIALGAIRELVRKAGINSSSLAPCAATIFELCNSQAWHSLARLKLQVEGADASIVPERAAAFPSSGPVVWMPLRSLVEELADRLGGEAVAQSELKFPLISVRKRRP
jgi:hypothetical protein